MSFSPFQCPQCGTVLQASMDACPRCGALLTWRARGRYAALGAGLVLGTALVACGYGSADMTVSVDGGWAERPTCVTRCGIRYYGPTTDGADAGGVDTCSALQTREDIALEVFERHVGWPKAQVCSRIGYRLELHDANDPHARAWYSERHGFTVGGLTYCGMSIVVATYDWRESALVHELAHAAEYCADPDHSTWNERGITAAIQEAHGRDR